MIEEIVKNDLICWIGKQRIIDIIDRTIQPTCNRDPLGAADTEARDAPP